MWHGELCPLQTMFAASDLKHCMFLFHFLPSVTSSILPLWCMLWPLLSFQEVLDKISLLSVMRFFFQSSLDAHQATFIITARLRKTKNDMIWPIACWCDIQHLLTVEDLNHNFPLFTKNTLFNFIYVLCHSTNHIWEENLVSVFTALFCKIYFLQ